MGDENWVECSWLQELEFLEDGGEPVGRIGIGQERLIALVGEGCK